MAARVLIIDDDQGFTRALSRNLRRAGHDVLLSETADDARNQILKVDADVVVLDYQLPDANGLALLEELRAMSAGTVFLMCTAYPEVDVAVKAMRQGAFDFVPKDLEPSEYMLRIERAAEVALLRRRMAEASRGTGDGESADQWLLGESPAIRALKTRLQALSGADDTTVLILGETGTGKGVLARAVHALSGRAFEPFVAVDCTTIPVTLVESELFGHERGAFSGAVTSKLGRVEAAGRGTLFLDEIGELEVPLQTKLLRLIEEREFTRVGSTRPRHLEARIITATNRNLERAVAEGRFRADLRYRLEVFVLEMPPLRDRGDDIFLYTAHFASERARTLGKPEPRLHPDVIAALPKYPFPGNIRELRNMVEQAVLLAERDELSLAEFPVLQRVMTGWQPPAHHTPIPPRPGPGGHSSLRLDGPSQSSSRPPSQPPPRPRSEPPPKQGNLKAIREHHATVEKTSLIHALDSTGGNVAAAARKLGISRYQMIRRLAKYGLRD